MNRLNRKIALLSAFALLAACGDSPAPGHQAALVDIAQAAARQDDRVSVQDLAGWLIEERQDFALIDVRAATQFERGHIAGAKSIPIAQLVTQESLAGLPADRKIVVYSNGSENGAKAATLLRMAGKDAHIVTGGYNAWHRHILNPDIPAEEFDGESPQISAQRAYSCYFVGDRGAGAARRSEVEFVPPVFTEEELDDSEELPPAGEESC